MSKLLPKALFDSLQYMQVNNYINLDHIQNKQDYQHACNFLLSYRGSLDTFNAYRREIERLLQWVWLIANKSLPQIKKQDFEQYLQFCKKPLKSWIGLHKVPRFINKNTKRLPNPNWRPFVVTVAKKDFTAIDDLDKNSYQLSRKAFKEIFAVCQSFYNYLLQENYVDINPVAQIRQKTKYFTAQNTKFVIRKLSDLQWSFVIEAAESMANSNPENERLLFIMNALYSLYLRISELAATSRWEPQMRDFYRDTNSNWWFKTVGKGNKERSIPVSNDLLKALKRYRKHLGLTALPSSQEQTPLLYKNKGQGPIASTKTIRNLVQQCFDYAIERMKRDGFIEDAEELKSATVHWLRHTGISNDIKFRPREHVRDDAGHSSSSITDKYIDVDLQERHLSARAKKIKPD